MDLTKTNECPNCGTQLDFDRTLDANGECVDVFLICDRCIRTWRKIVFPHNFEEVI